LYAVVSLCFFFFFFQAEDGIRDRNVTGVQTCALPISSSSSIAFCNQMRISIKAEILTIAYTISPVHGFLNMMVPFGLGMYSYKRSEERRVGKECRDWEVRCRYT